MSLPAIAELISALNRAMRERGLRWYVFGAQAVLAYGRPRFTADVDVAIEWPDGDSAALVEALRPHGFVLRFPASTEHLRGARLLPIVHTSTALPVDVVIAAPGLDEEFLERACLIDFGGVQAPVVSVEDLLAMKVLAGRRKDLEDISGILIERGVAIDLARTRDVLGALEAATGDRKLIPRLERLVRAAAKPMRSR